MYYILYHIIYYIILYYILLYYIILYFVILYIIYIYYNVCIYIYIKYIISTYIYIYISTGLFKEWWTCWSVAPQVNLWPMRPRRTFWWATLSPTTIPTVGLSRQDRTLPMSSLRYSAPVMWCMWQGCYTRYDAYKCLQHLGMDGGCSAEYLHEES